MFENIGWPEILVLVVAGLFILGPERLPEAAAWIGRTVRQVKDYATGARDNLKKEMGSDFEHLQQPLNDLRSLRNLNPKAAITRTLFSEDDDGPTKPNGYAPGPNGSAANGAAANGAAANGAAANGAAANGVAQYGPPANGAAANGAAPNGAPANGAPANRPAANVAATNGTPVAPSAAPATRAPMGGGERPPIDPDAT